MIYPVFPSISVEASVNTIDATRLIRTILSSHFIFVFFFINLYYVPPSLLDTKYRKRRNNVVEWMPEWARVEWNGVCFDDAAAGEVNLTA